MGAGASQVMVWPLSSLESLQSVQSLQRSPWQGKPFLPPLQRPVWSLFTLDSDDLSHSLEILNELQGKPRSGQSCCASGSTSSYTQNCKEIQAPSCSFVMPCCYKPCDGTGKCPSPGYQQLSPTANTGSKSEAAV